MKRIAFLFFVVALVALASCGGKGEKFVIKGTTTQSRLNGEQVFLVPFGGKHIEDSIGVDSVVIKDNKFEFTGRGEYMARVTISMKVRYGTQDLLVVTEGGGVINVVIDSVSHGGGTPQNEALEQWKTRKISHDMAVGPHVARLFRMRRGGDSINAKPLEDSLKVFNEAFRQDVLGITKVLGKGTVYDFLMKRYGNSPQPQAE